MTFKGGKIRLNQFRDKIVILNFWVSWCMACIREMPHFQDLNEKLSDQQFVILSINVKDRFQRVKRLLNKTLFKLDVILDSSGIIYKQYQVQTFPTAVIIDRQGKLIGRVQGRRDWSDPMLVNYLEHLYNMTDS